MSGATLALLLFSIPHAAGESPGIVVVTSSGVEAYGDAVQGLQAGLAQSAPRIVSVDIKAAGADAVLARALV